MPRREPPVFKPFDVVWIWDPGRARILWATPAAAAFWGASGCGELAARSFLEGDPNRTAMDGLTALAALVAARPDLGRPSAPETLVLHPEGAPRRLRAWTRVARSQAVPERVLAAIRATIAPRSETLSRDGVLLDQAATPLAMVSPDGAPLRLNRAAARLAGLGARAFAWGEDPEIGRRALAAAMLTGAFAHPARLRGAAPETRALMLYRRAADPETGEAAVTIEAMVQPADATPRAAATRDAAAFDASAPGRVGRARCALDGDFAVIDADPTALRLAPALGAAHASLAAAFPAQALALRAAVARLEENRAAFETVACALDHPRGRGPWGEARLWISAAPGAASHLELALIDLGPERRALLKLRREALAARQAVSAHGVGVVFLDRAGALLSATEPAARILGLEAARGEAGGARPLLAARLSDPMAERLTEALAGLAKRRDDPGDDPRGAPHDDPHDRGGAPILLEAPPASDGARRRARLAIAPVPGGPLSAQDAAACVAISDAAAARADPPRRAALWADEAQSVSHAFRTALTTIKGFAELMRDAASAPPTPPQRRYLDDIVATASDMTRLVAALFDHRRGDHERGVGGHPGASAAPSVDLAEIAAAAARRAAPSPVEMSALSSSRFARAHGDDVAEALDLLLPEAAARGATRISVVALGAGAMGGRLCAIVIETEAETKTETGSVWSAAPLRAAELLIERAGGRLAAPQDDEREAVARRRLELLFIAAPTRDRSDR